MGKRGNGRQERQRGKGETGQRENGKAESILILFAVSPFYPCPLLTIPFPIDPFPHLPFFPFVEFLMPDEPRLIPTKRRSLWKRVGLITSGVLLLYLAMVYLLVRGLWIDYAHHHPALVDTPGLTYTSDVITGGPLNVALVGTKTQVIRVMLAAQWHPADPLTLRSCLEIAAATMLDRPYDDAPVSSLYLWGRKEDLAFEQQVGPDPRKRHHVRFWQSEKVDADGRPLWMGSATYDQSVG